VNSSIERNSGWSSTMPSLMGSCACVVIVPQYRHARRHARDPAPW
jgi:hypothetical protein